MVYFHLLIDVLRQCDGMKKKLIRFFKGCKDLKRMAISGY